MQTPSQILEKAVEAYNAEENTHAKYAPSSAKRWCNCPGSVPLSEGKDDGANKYTSEGSLAHIICEQCLKANFTSFEMLEELVGDVHEVDGFEHEVTEEMIEACWLYAETIARDAIELGLTDDNINACLSVEQRVHIADDCDGTSDANLAVPFVKVIVYDFKYGAGVPVDVEDNYQMKCYTVGVFNEYEKDGNSYMDEVELVIIQPRARHKDGSVRRWTTTRDQILEFAVEIQECIDKCKVQSIDDITFKSGDWCRWCPGKSDCPDLFEESTEIAKTAFDIVDTKQDVLEAISVERMVKILDTADTITQFIKVVQVQAKLKLENGEDIPGWKLVRGKTSRSWVDPDDIARRTVGKIGKDVLYTTKIISPAAMEKALKKAGFYTSVAKAKSALEKYVNVFEGNFSIAPDHDTREQVHHTTAGYFDGVTGNDDNSFDL